MSDDRCELLCLDLSRAEDIRQHLDQPATANAASRGKALGDPTRLTIAVALRLLDAHNLLPTAAGR